MEMQKKSDNESFSVGSDAAACSGVKKMMKSDHGSKTRKHGSKSKRMDDKENVVPSLAATNTMETGKLAKKV